MSNRKLKWAAAAELILLIIAAIVIICLVSQKTKAEPLSTAGTEAGSVQQGSETAQDETVPEGIDFEAVFPSWNPDSASLHELVDFVSDSADESSPNYLDPADRIAAFDMDGTILCEKAPVYVDYCLTMYRVLDDPDYEATAEERSVMQQVRDHAYSEGETYNPEGLSKDDLVASAFAGMTPEAFRAYVVDFADSVEAIGFEGMTYGQSFYLPMMGQDEVILLGAPLDEVECGKSGKPAAIAREIGKRPVLAFGNSSGDYSMLNYAEGNPDHKGMGFFIVCDDTEREYGSEAKAADFYDVVEKEGWTAFSMAKDWRTIYGDGVQKTELPGIEEELPNAA